jgi:hypothetical protein
MDCQVGHFAMHAHSMLAAVTCSDLSVRVVDVDQGCVVRSCICVSVSHFLFWVFALLIGFAIAFQVFLSKINMYRVYRPEISCLCQGGSKLEYANFRLGSFSEPSFSLVTKISANIETLMCVDADDSVMPAYAVASCVMSTCKLCALQCVCKKRGSSHTLMHFHALALCHLQCRPVPRRIAGE